MADIASRLPLSCLQWPADTIAALAGLGVRNVADLLRLPRAGFVARFGPRLLDELDEGVGRRPEPRRRHVVPERFDEQHELPVETAAMAGVQPMLGTAARESRGFPARARRGCPRACASTCCIAARRRRGSASAWCDRPAMRPHLSGLVAERLARERLPAPVDALRLRSGVLLPLALRDARLFERGQSADPEATARLLDRLRARLGQDAVFGVCPVPEHRPERAWRIAEPGGTTPLPGQWPVTRPERPLWMLVEPQPFDGWEGTLVTGPERIETGWWDGHDIRRDYYVALTRAGVRLWLFRERPPGRGWFLHGVFG